MKKTKRLLLLPALLLVGLFARATDGKSEAPPDPWICYRCGNKKTCFRCVVVSAVSPGAANSKEVTTDADGYFHFAQLPANQVNLQFDKKGLQSYRRTSVLIKEKSTVRVNVDILPEDTENKVDDTEYPILRILQVH